ncbi:MAG: prolipoprotein diacylglyceryl transferase [Candidatus Hydrogenedentes bacterium]|nr:prolipoprotein diacylglyceryl transferase [Candidatus Hydrogenedentota bacterium]
MYPKFFSTGELHFHSYTVMMTIAFLVGTIGPIWLNRRREKPYSATPAGGIWIFLGGILGAKIWWAIQYGGADDWRYLQFIVHGGLVFFGGLFGGIVAGIIYLRLHKIPIISGADMVAPFMALAHGIGRIGCFLNGCCWGAVTRFSYPWAVRFPKGSSCYRSHIRENLITRDDLFSLPVHPTQIYETLGNFIIFVILLIIYKKRKHTGVVTLSYLMLYGLLRFITEIFRGESARPFFGLFTVSQIVALSLLTVGILLYAICSQWVWKKEPAPVASSEETTDSTEQ